MKSPRTDNEMIFQALEYLDQGISIFDGDLKLCHFNQRFVELMDYPQDLIKTGMHFGEILRFNIQSGEYGEGDPEQQYQERITLVQNLHRHRFTRIRPNGRVLSVKGAPLPAGGFITTYEDITKSHNEKLLVQQKEQQFRNYLELSPIGAVIVKPEGFVHYINHRMLNIFGYEESDVPTLNVKTFYNDLKDRETLLSVIDKEDSPSAFRFTGKKKDGSTFPMLISTQRVILEGQELLYSWIIDLTAMKEAEKAIQHLNEQNELILSSVGAGILGVDEDNIIQFINPAGANLLEYNELDLIGEPLEILTGSTSQLLHSSLDDVQSGETKILCHSKRALPIKYNTRFIKDLKGTPGRIIVFDDISDRIATEEVLRQAMQNAEASSKAKSQFLSIMSHELRTPLNAILGFSQILKANPDQNLQEKQITFLDHMERAGHHLLKLVNETLDIATIETGKISLSLQTLNLVEIVDQAIKESSELASMREITIASEICPASRFLLIADHGRLLQICMHLISNAVKYNRKGGTITIDCKYRKDMVRLSISDTGIGMEQSSGNDIFAPFNRLDSSEESVEGTGLGLTLCKKLTDLMGGNIGYYTIKGKGSRFWVEFPKSDESSPLIVPHKH